MAKFLQIVNGVPRMASESAAVAIYDQTTLLVAGVTTGTAITLPASGTYTGEELEVRLNGVKQDSAIDYNFVGSPPRTQISMTYDLVAGDYLNFRVDRPA
jgi:hypothetical protein